MKGAILVTNKEASTKQESMIAKSLAWKTVTGSGSTPFRKGDVVSDKWLGECKTHTSSGHKIVFDLDVWSKIKDEAQVHNRFPVLFVDDGSQKLSETWACFQVSPFSEFSNITDTTSILNISDTSVRFASSNAWDHMLAAHKLNSDISWVYEVPTRCGTLYITPLLTFVKLNVEG